MSFSRIQGFLQGRDVFIQDCYGGADQNYRLPVRIISELKMVQSVCAEYVY
jgi:phosphoenolpyruvate carboxykinase (ATP)